MSIKRSSILLMNGALGALVALSAIPAQADLFSLLDQEAQVHGKYDNSPVQLAPGIRRFGDELASIGKDLESKVAEVKDRHEKAEEQLFQEISKGKEDLTKGIVAINANLTVMRNFLENIDEKEDTNKAAQFSTDEKELKKYYFFRQMAKLAEESKPLEECAKQQDAWKKGAEEASDGRHYMWTHVYYKKELEKQGADRGRACNAYRGESATPDMTQKEYCCMASFWKTASMMTQTDNFEEGQQCRAKFQNGLEDGKRTCDQKRCFSPSAGENLPRTDLGCYSVGFAKGISPCVEEIQGFITRTGDRSIATQGEQNKKDSNAVQTNEPAGGSSSGSAI